MKHIKIDEKEYKKKQQKKWIQFETVIKLCKEEAESGLIGALDIDCGVNFWIHKQYIYAIPVCQNWMKHNLRFPNWVEDYSYWDNSDKPERISDKEWDLRDKMWNKINCGTGRSDHNSRRLYHEIIRLEGNNSFVSETELQLKIFSKTRN